MELGILIISSKKIKERDKFVITHIFRKLRHFIRSRWEVAIVMNWFWGCDQRIYERRKGRRKGKKEERTFYSREEEQQQGQFSHLSYKTESEVRLHLEK